jgi:hypothetical protein
MEKQELKDTNAYCKLNEEPYYARKRYAGEGDKIRQPPKKHYHSPPRARSASFGQGQDSTMGSRSLDIPEFQETGKTQESR